MCGFNRYFSTKCYYIGALETSATRIITSVTKPLSYGKPVEKICKDLGKKDSEICELEYGEKERKGNTKLMGGNYVIYHFL